MKAVCFAGLCAVSVTSSVALGGPITSLSKVSSQGFGDIGNTTATSPTSDIANATAFSFGVLVSTAVHDGRFADMPPQSFGSVSFTVADPFSLQFSTAAFGQFASTSITELSNVNGSRSFKFGGMFTSGTYGGPMQPDPTVAEFTVSFNQNGGAGTAISSNGTIAIVTVPEPGTLALVAAAAVTAIACRRRWR